MGRPMNWMPPASSAYFMRSFTLVQRSGDMNGLMFTGVVILIATGKRVVVIEKPDSLFIFGMLADPARKLSASQASWTECSESGEGA
jgi:hypothetical protein